MGRHLGRRRHHLVGRPALWIVIPVGFALWVLVVSWTARVGLGEFLGWLDLNLMAAVRRVMVRPFIGSRVAFVPVRLIQSVAHRIHVVGPRRCWRVGSSGPELMAARFTAVMI